MISILARFQTKSIAQPAGKKPVKTLKTVAQKPSKSKSGGGSQGGEKKKKRKRRKES